MHLNVRLKIMAALSLILLTLFFAFLYVYLSTGLEKHASGQVESLARYAVALVEDKLHRAEEALDLAVSLRQGPAGRFEAFFGDLSGPRQTIFEHMNGALFTRERELRYFGPDGNMVVDPLNPAYASWAAALSSATEQKSIVGPLPPLGEAEEAWVMLFLKRLEGTPEGGEAEGETVAVCVALDSIAIRLYSFEALNIGGRQAFLVNERGEILIPAAEARKSPAAPEQLSHRFRGLTITEPDKSGRYVAEDEEYIVAKVPVAGSGWDLLLFSPLGYELRFNPVLYGAFGGAWLCLCLFVILFLHLARRNVHYKVLSEIDHLTGAGNRLAFEKHLEGMGANGRFPLCLIVMDVDGLKLINDKLGHQAGDSLLRRVTLLVQRSLRDNDAVYRIGGDEFAVIIPGATYSVAQPLTERINAQAALMREKVGLPPIHISLGLAEARDQETFATLFKRADAAMYANKKGRRDMVHKALLQWLMEHPDQIDRRLKKR